MDFKGKRFFWRIKEIKLGDIKSCIVQRIHENGNRSFSTFDDWNVFYDWYIKVNPSNRTFSEVILDVPQKFRIDVDAADVDKNILLRVVLDSFKKVLSIISDENAEIITYDSSSESKISFHFIAHGISSNSEGCSEVARFVSYLCEDYGKFIDISVYKKFQCFRLEGSSKMESPRRYKNLLLLPEMKRVQGISNNFFKGLITDVRECQYISVDLSSFSRTYTSKILASDPEIPYVRLCEICGNAEIVSPNTKSFFCYCHKSVISYRPL